MAKFVTIKPEHKAISKNKTFYLFITFCLTFALAPVKNIKSQTKPEAQQVIEQIIEELAQNSDEEPDFTEITEKLESFIETPINLNQTTVEQLEELRFLTDFQILSLTDYVNKYGSLKTIYELQLIDGFNNLVIKKLLPFVTINNVDTPDKLELYKALKYGKNEIFTRVSAIIEQAAGYKPVSDSVYNLNPNKYYPGNRARIFTRYKFNYKNQIQMGITAEKDPGEQFFKGAQKQGFDFYSAHLQINNPGIIKTINIGDYLATFGQGLVMSGGLGMGKSALVLDIRKKNHGLRRYSSADENNFLRGAGLTFGFKKLSFTTFASYNYVDAVISAADTTNNLPERFSSLQLSGLHATPNQTAYKNTLKIALAGSNITVNHKNLKIGATALAYKYNIQQIKSNSPADIYSFNGTNNTNFGVNFLYYYKGIHIFGEGAISQNKGKAMLAGALFKLNSQISTALLYRNYARNYQAAFANGFGDAGNTQNENGIYFGTEIYPIKNWKISGYYDMFTFPWIKQQTTSPANGYDYLLQADYSANRNTFMYWRIKSKKKQEKTQTNNLPDIQNMLDKRTLNLRYNISYSINNQWRFQNRVEFANYNNGQTKSEQGIMVFQDISYNSQKYPVSVSARLAIYNTDTYNSRIYTFENDVLNAYSVPALYGRGTRVYLLANFEPVKNITCWLRFSQSYFADKTTIGSGLDIIDGQTKSELKFQFRYRF